MSKDVFEALRSYRATEETAKAFLEREKERQRKWQKEQDAIRIKKNRSLPIVYDL